MSDVVWLRDRDGTGSMHACAHGDPGSVAYAPADDFVVVLDALKEMVRWHAKRGGPDDLPLGEDEQDPEVAQAMRAIARAEGRT